MLDEPTAGVSPIVMDELFDRIIEVPLPDKAQRKEIIQNLMRNMPTKIVSGKAIDKVAAKSEGLSGAWIREVVQTAMIEAISEDREEILVCDLEQGLKDVLQRRGMSYKATPRLSDSGSRNSEVSVMWISTIRLDFSHVEDVMLGVSSALD